MTKRKFPRVHMFKLTVTFNRGVRRAKALWEVRDNIHGQHYCSELEDGDPTTFRVRGIKNLSRRR